MFRRSGICVLALVMALAVLPTVPTSAVAEATSGSYEVTAPDGTVLRGWLFLPEGEPPFATVLEYTPYIDNNGSTASGGPGGLQYLLDAGFAIARVSVRGTGRSAGCLQFGGPIDVEDVTVVVEDLARQPWSNGNIGMTGHSYPGWTSDMGAAAAPPALKAVVPTSGVIDLWSLLTRRGAPLAAGLGVLFSPAWTAQTGVLNPGLPEREGCPALPFHFASNTELAVTGDRTDWFQARSTQEGLTGTRVPMLRSNGLIPVGEGHVMQVEGLWERLRPDRTRFVLGQWYHQPPPGPEWRETVTAWFDHYLRGGPRRVKTGVAEYQDDSGAWHTADQWPPRSRELVMHLSGDALVPDGDPVVPADTTFVSADSDPGLNVGPGSPRYNVAVCGPHQALYTSAPLSEDALLAGNFEVDITLTSTLPGGNFSVYLWKTSGDGSCPDLAATEVTRALMDLRHWRYEGRSRDFPVAAPTSFTLRSQPFASQLREGERLVVAIGGGSVELTPDARKPVLTVNAGTFRLPVVSGELRLVD
jgi:uncharacterized protein